MEESKIKSWDVLNDFLKTIITISIAFITFTATFSENLYNPKVENIPFLLILTWVGNVVVIFLAMFSVAKISSYLYDDKKPNIPIGFSNTSYFTLLGTMILFLIFIVSKQENENLGIQLAEKQAVEYLDKTDPIFKSNSTIVLKQLDSNKIWNFKFVNICDTINICVDKETYEIISYRKVK